MMFACVIILWQNYLQKAIFNYQIAKKLGSTHALHLRQHKGHTRQNHEISNQNKQVENYRIDRNLNLYNLLNLQIGEKSKL